MLGFEKLSLTNNMLWPSREPKARRSKPRVISMRRGMVIKMISREAVVLLVRMQKRDEG